MTELLKEISDLLEIAGIPNYIDTDEKFFSGDRYIGVYRNKKCLYFTHLFDKDYLQAICHRKISPENIESKYGIKVEGDPKDKFYRSKSHYVLDLPLRNDLINGKFKIHHKRDFFIDMARLR